MGKKTVEEEPIAEYDQSNIPEQKAKDILDSPEENEEYFPCPYKYFYKDEKIDREVFEDLKQELKNPQLLKKVLKTQEELETDIMQDSCVYDSEWDFFLESISGFIDDRNPKGYWETPCNNEDEHGDDCDVTDRSNGNGSRELSCDTGKELMDKLIDFKKFYNETGPIRIYSYKKDGLKIRASHHDEIVLLPSCRTGFIRDWDHDGICIARIENEED